MKTIEYETLMKVWLLIAALFGILLGCRIGLSIRKVETITIYSEDLDSTMQFASSNEDNFKSSNLSRIHIASNPCKTAGLTPRIRKGHLDFSTVGNETVRKPSNLLTIAVGVQQKDMVNKIVSKFSEDFAIILFHYDGKASEWDQFEWSQRAIHISVQKQAKWWYAKRFLHPEVVAQYEYIFMWDEDLGVDHFNAQEYIKLVKKYDLEISQPAITSETRLTWKVTQKRMNVEVHRLSGEMSKRCPSPCAGFVEIMAPVFSRKSWNCVWHMIQNDLVHGWGLDFAFWRCVEKPEEKIGIVDAQWVNHLELPTLGHKGKSVNRKQGRGWVRRRSAEEWQEFEKRMRAAEEHYHPLKK